MVRVVKHPEVKYTTFDTGYRLVNGVLLEPTSDKPLDGNRLASTLSSYGLFSQMKDAKRLGCLTNKSDADFADKIIAAWAADGYE